MARVNLVDIRADHYRMERTVNRTRTAPTFQVVELTQHWTIERGWYMRDAWVRLEDGTVELFGLPDGRVGDAR